MNLDREAIEALVREVVTKTLGQTAPTANAASGKRPFLDADTLQQQPPHSTYRYPANTLVTPLARQVALERHIHLEAESTSAPTAPKASFLNIPAANSSQATVAIGADHGGYALKEQIKKQLETADPPYTVIDCGAHSTDSVDYPDYAYAVAGLVANGTAWRGIMIDGAGIGSCMAANKVPGVRAAMCYDQATAVNSREHNNANVLTLGAGLIGPNLAQQIVSTWLQTEFGGGRHARRVDKIDAIGKRYTHR